MNKHDCERCKVPNAYGYFLVWRRGKAEWEQRFILEADRKAIMRHYDCEIIRAQVLRDAVEKIPSKEEYEATIKKDLPT